MKLTNYERKNYVLKEKKDFEILKKIKQLEKLDINKKNREILRLIRSQLKRNWRTPLVKYLDKMRK